MNPVKRPCLNRGPDCADLPGDCTIGPDGKLDQQLLHAHYGMRPDECRLCGCRHNGDRCGLCAACEIQVDASCRASQSARCQFAELSNPHLDFQNLTPDERFEVEYEEVPA